MTDREIIKAAEHCYTNSDCDGCPQLEYRRGCANKILEDLFEVANRQQAEIEKLKDMVAQNEGVLPEYEKLFRAEAINEFAERLRNYYKQFDFFDTIHFWEVIDHIDLLVEEMVGEEQWS